jgi:hypothetical protein
MKLARNWRAANRVSRSVGLSVEKAMKLRHLLRRHPPRVPQALAARLNRRIRWDFDDEDIDESTMGLGCDASEREGSK